MRATSWFGSVALALSVGACGPQPTPLPYAAIATIVADPDAVAAKEAVASLVAIGRSALPSLDAAIADWDGLRRENERAAGLAGALAGPSASEPFRVRRFRLEGIVSLLREARKRLEG